MLRPAAAPLLHSLQLPLPAFCPSPLTLLVPYPALPRQSTPGLVTPSPLDILPVCPGGPPHCLSLIGRALAARPLIFRPTPRLPICTPVIWFIRSNLARWLFVTHSCSLDMRSMAISVHQAPAIEGQPWAQEPAAVQVSSGCHACRALHVLRHPTATPHPSAARQALSQRQVLQVEWTREAAAAVLGRLRSMRLLTHHCAATLAACLQPAPPKPQFAGQPARPLTTHTRSPGPE